MDNYVEVSLHDVESEEKFQIKLSPADTLRAQNSKLWLCYGR